MKDNKVREEKDIAPRPRYPRDQMVFPFAKSKPKPYGLHEEFVRDTLIPEINKTVRQGLA